MTMVSTAPAKAGVQGVEWATLALIAGCYGVWGVAIGWLWVLSPVLSVTVAGLAVTLHASLTHEVLHGHPFSNRRLSEALMRLPLGLLVPYCRFRDLHLAHHRDSNLTDPYDDPESMYLDPATWDGLPGWRKALFAVNNTLAGRVLIGPVLGQAVFLQDELRLWRDGVPGIARAWALHLAGVVPVLCLVALSPMPIWAYLVAVYLGHGILRIRTFLEHQAHARSRARTVIIEDRGLLAFLFLNNNLHVVHHMHPGLPWYALPSVYRARAERYRQVNDGYVYRSYGEVFRRHFLRAKEPVAHPLWRSRE